MSKPIVYYYAAVFSRIPPPHGRGVYIWPVGNIRNNGHAKPVKTLKVIAYNPETGGIETKTTIYLPEAQQPKITHVSTSALLR